MFYLLNGKLVNGNTKLCVCLTSSFYVSLSYKNKQGQENLPLKGTTGN